MKNEKLMKAMTNIDDEMLLNAVNASPSKNISYKKQNPLKKWIATAAAVLLVFSAGFASAGMIANNQVAATIALDINPSMEIEVNKNDKVLRVNALNQEAVAVIGDMDLEKVDLDVAINALIGSMLQKGYLSIDQNSIMISVASEDMNKQAELQTALSTKVENLLNQNNLNASIITQTYENSESLSAKDTLVQKVVNSGLTDAKGTPYTPEQLQTMNINEIKVLLESKDTVVSGITSVGTASNEAYIGKETALDIAIKAALGISSNDPNTSINTVAITDKKCEMDYEKGAMVYEVEFTYMGKEYDYEINAKTGEILHYDIEIDDDYVSNSQPNQPVTPPVTETTPPAQTETPATPPTQTTPTYIGKDTALSTAYGHAGVSAASVSRVECELDRDDGIAVYEISFHSGGYEYDYEINAATGTIIEWDKEIED